MDPSDYIAIFVRKMGINGQCLKILKIQLLEEQVYLQIEKSAPSFVVAKASNYVCRVYNQTTVTSSFFLN